MHNSLSGLREAEALLRVLQALRHLPTYFQTPFKWNLLDFLCSQNRFVNTLEHLNNMKGYA